MTIFDAQKDWRVLDRNDFQVPGNVRLISHEKFDTQYTRGMIPVEEIRQGWLSRTLNVWPFLASLVWALQLLLAADRNTVIIANGSTSFGNQVCLLNYYLFHCKRTILFWDSHIEPVGYFKNYLAKRCFLGCTLATHWSKKQPGNYSKRFDLPEDKFIFIPYKANHSKQQTYDLNIGGYIFSGGNGKRDYKSLVEAVRETNIPVIISTTIPEIRSEIEKIPNVIVLGAPEPAFAQLQACANFVVIPMVSTGLKGGGEANFCNAMWHGRPVIAMDDVSAEDYIIDGETGYIVPPGDVDLLRERIIELWNDPQKCHEMGAKGKEIVQKYYTQIAGIKRLVRLACLLGSETQANAKLDCHFL